MDTVTRRNPWSLCLAVLALSAIGLVMQGCKDEHPTGKKEHPTKAEEQPAAQPSTEEKPAAEHPAEHPEHPEKGSHVEPATPEALARAIERHVQDQLNADGWFSIRDDIRNKDLMTKLDKVHTERLSQIEDNLYFACCDFKAEDGTVYDVDFWMSHSGTGWTFSELKVHKVNGKPRYNWEETNGRWHTVPLQ